MTENPTTRTRWVDTATSAAEASSAAASTPLKHRVRGVVTNLIGPLAGVAGVYYASKGDANSATFYLSACTLLMTAQGNGKNTI